MTNSWRNAVLVTGASSGIGAACARYLDAQGFSVFAGVRRVEDGEALRRLASDRLTPLLLDVTDLVSIEAARACVAEKVETAGLAGLVNNAGIAVAGPLELLPLEDMRTQLEINVLGVLAVTQAFLPLVRKSGGRIINMSSIAGRAATPFLGAYCGSKFALEAMTDALRLELAPWGIRVTLIEPGAIQSNIWARSTLSATRALAGVSADRLALYEPQLRRLQEVLGRAAQRAIPSDEVARVVRHVMTVENPRARYLVGKDAKFRALLKRILPDRLQDRLLAWYLGLSRTAS
ncbi:MAG: SDR family oxidoreductase [Nitrospiraceae bacterium]|nr:SDR family oxidoreductase [Nitrospiraceae bacterium]